MLYLISLGLNSKDLSLAGLEAIKNCEKLYLERYTTFLQATVKDLEKVCGMPIAVLEREDMEEHSSSLVEEARTKNIGILVGGDPLAATTHTSLLLDCKRANVGYHIVHGPSIFTAVAETGLSLYKFGEVVSIPFWRENYQPTGFGETIEKNKAAGLHTLILLDTAQGGMSVSQGLEVLERVRPELLEEEMVAVSAAGSGEQKIVRAAGKDLKEKDLGKPAVLVVPGKLNVFEKEFLNSF